MTPLESDFQQQLLQHKIPEPRSEYLFHPLRQWRLDFAWPSIKLGVELDGLVANGVGGHQTIDGVNKDCQKLSEAIKLDWRVFRFTRSMVDSGEACDAVLWVLASQGLYNV